MTAACERCYARAVLTAPRPRYVVDAVDPRAPDDATWALLSEEERRQVVASLPAEVPWELSPPEGDEHRMAREGAMDALGRFFRTTGRRVYLSSEMGVFYPGEPRFSPDVLAVLDTELRPRRSWIVTQEGRGLDFVLEVHVEGDLAKDLTGNVEKYARLGIGEYFVFDKTHQRIHGYRLPPSERGTARAGRAYDRLVPQMGRWASDVLGIDLTLENGTLRLMVGNAALEQSEEVIARLGGLLDAVLAKTERDERERLEALARADDLAAKLAEAEQARDAERQAREAESRAREAAEQRIAALEEELKRRGG